MDITKVKQILKFQGLTQKELAEKIGMTEVGLSRAINDGTTKGTALKIATALNVTIEDIASPTRTLKAKYGSEKTPLKLGSLEIPCYVLEDNTRVFSGRGLQKILGVQSQSGSWLSSFINNSSITSYLECSYIGENSLIEKLNAPIVFERYNAGGSQTKTYGYEATLLIDICDAIIQSHEDGLFSDVIILENARTIIRAVAKVGIIALVDEATGYNRDKNRAKDELQKVLSELLNKDASKWVKTFDDVFFEDLYKMRGWSWESINKRPGIVGKWIDDIVYQRLAPVILSELRKLNPKNVNGNRSKRHHQFLTENIGIPKLKQHLAGVHALAVVSDYNWSKFMVFMDKTYPKQYQQLSLFDDEWE